MLKTPVYDVLDKFGRYVKQQAKSNLTKKKHKDTAKLYDSMSYYVKESKNSFEFGFSMEYYGEFIDKGVRGAGGVRKTTSQFKSTNNKGKLWKIKAKNSPFRFRDIKPSVKHFEGWSKRRGLNPYAVREAVYHQGIETTNFLTLPFERAFERLPEQVIEAYGLQVERFMKTALKNG